MEEIDPHSANWIDGWQTRDAELDFALIRQEAMQRIEELDLGSLGIGPSALAAIRKAVTSSYLEES